MKKILLVALLPIFFITGCNHIEITTKIYPKVTVIGDKVGLIYKLGDLEVMDQLDLSESAAKHIKTHESEEFFLKVIYNENTEYKSKFSYFLDGILIAESKDVVSGPMLISHRDTIPNFLCIQGDCKVTNDSVKKGDKNESSVKEEKPAPTPPVENKNMNGELKQL